ncbi:hypothetical protein BJZ21_004094 [Nocardioides panaciterrulae]|uniref:Uncharacterized protein n=1 Tax=Nocardioides panaciterrulae TaxID=661492 RepID=A0A7Y9EAQ0_9ACTN|nr:hypothetical protein [Nocardioides panaciterrulae]
MKEIKAVESAEGDDAIGKAMDTPDDNFDPNAL